MLMKIRARGIRVLTWIVCIQLMILIGSAQAVGTLLTAISAIVFKTIGSLIICVSLMLLAFGLFTWVRTLVVVLISVGMFWLPEGIALVVLGLTFIQAKLRDLLDCH